MKLILHSCCAPCSIKCVDTLKQEGIEPTVFWYNPNIHPFTEYRNRKNAFLGWSKEENLESLIKNEYGLRKFIDNVYPNYSGRCSYCYTVRLEETAKTAKENGFTHFSTTLLISPYQKHEMIKHIGEEISHKYGIGFLYRDFRPYFRDGQRIARENGIYMQKYCGCIFSEEERYLKIKI